MNKRKVKLKQTEIGYKTKYCYKIVYLKMSHINSSWILYWPRVVKTQVHIYKSI